MLSNCYGFPKYFSNGFGIVFSEVGNGVMIGYERPHQPHYLKITFTFFFQLPGRTNAVEIPIDKQLEVIRRVISRPSVLDEAYSEPQIGWGQSIDKSIHHTGCIIGSSGLV